MQTFDQFEIRFNLFSFGLGEICVVAEIYINDRALLDIVREIEKSFGESNPGDYSYLIATSVLLPSRYLLDKPDDLDSGRSMVLGCTCGWPECWCLRVRIAVTDSTVEWSDFRHDFRDWEYNLGFRFDQNQYLAELSKVVPLPTSDAEDYHSAIADYDRAIELNPNDAFTYYCRGQAKSKLGNKPEAIADLTTASELSYQQDEMDLYHKIIDLIGEK
jgi:tetratricopeptide (TPR) repeat protein